MGTANSTADSSANVPLEHPEWGSNVIRNRNGKIRDPIGKAMSGYIFSFDYFNLSLGIPLNVYLVLVILFLNKNSVNSLITLSNWMRCCAISWLCLTVRGIEAAYYFNPGNDQLCHSFVYTMSIAPNAFIFNVFLSVVNQFSTIKYHNGTAWMSPLGVSYSGHWFLILFLLCYSIGCMFAVRNRFVAPTKTIKF